MPDTDTSRQTRRTTLPRHKQAPQLAPCQGRRDCVKGHVTSKIQPGSQILRKRGPQKLMKTHVRPLLPATDPVAKNIGPITWPQRACRYHQKQDIPEHLRGRTLWAPCSRPVWPRTGQKWGPEIGLPIIAGPHLRRGPLWSTPSDSAPAPACTHPVGALLAPDLRAHRPNGGPKSAWQ